MIELVDQISFQATSWLQAAYIAMSVIFSGPILTLTVTLFLVLWGYSIMSGRTQTLWVDFVGKAAVIVIVLLGVTNAGYFNSILKVFFLQWPDDMASDLIELTGGFGVGSVRSGLETCYEEAFKAAETIWDEAGITDVLLNLLGIIIIIAMTCFVGYACFLIALAKVATCILLALTPLMFLSLLFPLTRSIFERWMGMLFNYFFIVLLVYVILSFITDIAQQTAFEVSSAVERDGDGTPALLAISKFLALCTIGFLLLIQTFVIASALGGGVALNTLGAAGMAFSALRNRFSPSQKRYTSGGPGFEGRTRTALGDVRRAARAFGYKRDRDGQEQKS